MEPWTDIAVGALAGSQLTEVLRHGSLAFPLRKWGWYHEAHPQRGRRWLAKWLGCPFCHSHWLIGLSVLWLLCWPTSHPCCYLWYAAAGVRLGQALNDLLHRRSRSPQRERPSDYIESLTHDADHSLPATFGPGPE